MNWFETAIAYLGGLMPTPEPFGWIHLVSIGVIAISIIITMLCMRRRSDKANRAMLLTYAIIAILFETYRQLILSFDPATGIWSFDWASLPFQLCLMPMYVALIAGLSRPGKFQSALMTFLGTFGLVVGLAIIALPTDVLSGIIGFNVHAMFVYGGMVVLGVYCLVSGRVAMKSRVILGAIPVFVIPAVIGLGASIAMWHFDVSHTVNLFYLSPYITTTLPLLDWVYTNVHYGAFLAAYFVGFSLIAYATLLVAMLINKLANLGRNRGRNR